MTLRVAKIPAVKGFMPTTYAVYWGEKVVRIFLTRKEAETFAKSPTV